VASKEAAETAAETPVVAVTSGAAAVTVG